MYGYLFLFLLLLLILSAAIASFGFAPWVPVFSKDLSRIFKLADLKQGEKFIDLGCGDGRVIAMAAKNYGAQVLGIELSIPLYIVSKIRSVFLGKNFSVRYGDLYNLNLSPFDIVYFYGVPNTIKNKLKQKMEKELQPGARVISYCFQIEGWQPAIIDRPSKKELPIYLYKI